MTRILAALIALAPAAAVAHAGPEGHLHPHGVETLVFAALAVGAVWAARRALR
ncbi:MAG: hypothetical protein ACU0DT_20310 [Albimonas sp.]|uniref:hypothetical protein n=1 Tax=Albimonas sp. TaxID=1872425 RepID=UPI004055F4A0|tara:strand:- start:867 stop:1025 length:159 start_codon:yes stop_codon:yes gene_type:complete